MSVFPFSSQDARQVTVPVGIADLCRFSQCTFEGEAGILVTPDCRFIEIEYSETDAMMIHLLKAETQDLVHYEGCQSIVAVLWGGDDSRKCCRSRRQ